MIPSSTRTQRPRFASANQLFVKVGIDFIMHDTGLYGSSNSAFSDCLWNLAHGSLALYFLSEPDSEWRVRQVAASLVHFHRVVATSAISALDVGIGKIVDTLSPRVPLVSSQYAKKRALKRLLLALVRNGGVYRDVFEFVRSIAPVSHDLDAIIHSAPFIGAEMERPAPDHDEVVALIERELKRRVRKVFSVFPSHPAEINGPFVVYDAHLRGGRQVSVSVILPRVERMRRYDLAPFKAVAAVLGVIPGVKAERNLLKAVLRRLDVSVQREFDARWAILEEFGVDKSGDIKEIVEESRDIDLPLRVPAPFPHLTTEHVMVSDVQLHGRIKASNPLIAYSVASFASQLSTRAGLIVPDLGISNVRVNQCGRTSLAQFSSLRKIKRSDIEACGRLAAALVTHEGHRYATALHALGVRGRAAEPLIDDRFRLWPTIRSVASCQPDLIASGTELMFTLSGHAASACSSSLRQFMTWRDAMTDVISEYSLSL